MLKFIKCMIAIILGAAVIVGVGYGTAGDNNSAVAYADGTGYTCTVLSADLSGNSIAVANDELQTRATKFNGFPLDDYSWCEQKFSKNQVLARGANLNVFNEMQAVENVNMFSYSLIFSVDPSLIDFSGRQYATFAFGNDFNGTYRSINFEVNIDSSSGYSYFYVFTRNGNNPDETLIKFTVPTGDRVDGFELRVTESVVSVYWHGVNNVGGKIYELGKKNNLSRYNDIKTVLLGSLFSNRECYFGNKDVSSSYTVTEQGRGYYAVPVSLPDTPVKEGYDFLGWFYGNGEHCGSSCVAYDGEPIYANTNLHAHFAIKKYSVTYDCAGGYGVDNLVLEHGTVAPTPVPSRIGYKFLGWKMSDGNYYDGAAVVSDLLLTAEWEVLVYEVKFYVDNELYAEETVRFGATLGVLEQIAEDLSLQIDTVKCGDELFTESSFVSDNCSVTALHVERSTNGVNNANVVYLVCGIAGFVVLVGIVGLAFGIARKR